MADVTPATICLRCRRPCELGDLVYVMVSAAVNDPNSFLGVTEIGFSGRNGVVHQSCFDREAPADDGDSCVPEAPEEEAVTLQSIQRTSTIEDFDLG